MNDGGAEQKPAYRVVDFSALPKTPCPCGEAQRAFVDEPAFPGSLHVTQITSDAQAHFHRQLTETYFILECEPGAYLELDSDRIALRPGMAILIPPGTVHRAVGKIRLLNIVHPAFDPSDEHLVPPSPDDPASGESLARKV